MFEGVRARWKEARGGVLREEFEDLGMRMHSFDRAEAIEFTRVLAGAYEILVKSLGDPTKLPTAAKIKHSKIYATFAKQEVLVDRGKAYALAILSMHLEALALPGADAAFVTAVTGEAIMGTLKDTGRA